MMSPTFAEISDSVIGPMPGIVKAPRRFIVPRVIDYPRFERHDARGYHATMVVQLAVGCSEAFQAFESLSYIDIQLMKRFIIACKNAAKGGDMIRVIRRLGLTTAFCSLAIAAAVTPSVAQTKVRVAVVLRDFNNPYWRALRDGAVEEGKKLKVPVVVQSGATETDSIGENAKISTMANQNFTCFGIVPVNGTNVITPLLPLSQKGIPIINLDTALDPNAVKSAGLKIAAFIGSDNKEAGKIDGEFMLEKLGGHGKVVILEGIPGEQNGINREAAYRQAVQGKLDIVAAQPANYERQLGLTVAEDMLQVHRDLSGIFSANDEMALGAVQAEANAGLTGKITVVSVDGISEALQSVKSGGLSGTVSQYPYAEGEMVVQACQQIAEGKSIATSVVSPIKLITAENVDQAIKASPRPFFTFDDPFGAP